MEAASVEKGPVSLIDLELQEYKIEIEKRFGASRIKSYIFPRLTQLNLERSNDYTDETDANISTSSIGVAKVPVAFPSCTTGEQLIYDVESSIDAPISVGRERNESRRSKRNEQSSNLYRKRNDSAYDTPELHESQEPSDSRSGQNKMLSAKLLLSNLLQK